MRSQPESSTCVGLVGGWLSDLPVSMKIIATLAFLQCENTHIYIISLIRIRICRYSLFALVNPNLYIYL